MKKIKSVLPFFITVAAVTVFSICSKEVAESVKQSLKLCYTSVIPSLLPFFILCDFLMHLSIGIDAPANITAFVGGLITGFPTGVKNVCTLYTNGNLDRKSATALLHCTANASPAYIISFIGICIIHNKNAGIILFISQCICALVCAFFFGCFKKQNKRYGKAVSITESLCLALSESVKSCLNVCGYIIFFGIFADLLMISGITNGLPNELSAIIIGAIEISRGLSLIEFKSQYAIVAASVILAFSGISVIMQCIGCTVRSGLSVKAIIGGKLAYIVLMPAVSYLLYSLKNYLAFVVSLVFIFLCALILYIIFDKSKRRLYNK